MGMLDVLSGCAGAWRGTNRLQVSAQEPADESPSELNITIVLGGRFLRIDQKWARQGRPQEGSLLIGYDPDSQVATAHWIDTFHMGHKVMECRGVITKGGALDVRGSYAAPPGPDWGWRITLAPAAAGGLEISMFNIDPEGKEELAVSATYQRVE
jgi:hypothetical protein